MKWSRILSADCGRPWDSLLEYGVVFFSPFAESLPRATRRHVARLNNPTPTRSNIIHNMKRIYLFALVLAVAFPRFAAAEDNDPRPNPPPRRSAPAPRARPAVPQPRPASPQGRAQTANSVPNFRAQQLETRARLNPAREQYRASQQNRAVQQDRAFQENRAAQRAAVADQNRPRAFTPRNNRAAIDPGVAAEQNASARNAAALQRMQNRRASQNANNANTAIGARGWRNGDDRGHRDWQNRNGGDGKERWDRDHRRGGHDWDRHRRDRSWWRSHYTRFALFGGGYYYLNSGFWYPAYGYDPYFNDYAYDAPLYSYDDLAPGQVIANVQAELQRRGYDTGGADGEYGPETREAILAFQNDNGLEPTGEIDEDTLAALGLQ